MILFLIFGGLILAAAAYYGVLMFVSKNRGSLGSAPLSPGVDSKINADVLLQSVADGVILVDVTGKITLINPSAAELIGWKVSDALGLNVSAVFKLAMEDGKALDPNANPFTSVVRTKQAFKSNLQLTSKSGANRIVSFVVSPLLLPPNYELLGAVAVVRDISRQHQEEAQRAEFISTASHEMRTPVAAIEGYLSLAMNERVSKIDSKAREYLEKAHASTQHLGKLFQDLLTSAKAEDGRLSNTPTIVECGAMMEQLSQDLKFAAEKKGLTLELTIGSGGEVTDARDSNSKVVRPLYYANIDPDRMHEVITNLADNAIKYTDSGKITLGLTGDKDVIQIFVRDTGAGIPPEDLPHLFQKFYRVNNSMTRTVGGTGLGLFISKKIISLYGGRLWAESQVGKGSTFYINLPRINNEKAMQMKQAEANKPAAMPVGGATV